MVDERNKQEEDVVRRPRDQRMQYGEIERRDKEGEDTAPYDQAPPDAPDDRVITKGEHEKPGPTSVEELTGDEETETE